MVDLTNEEIKIIPVLIEKINQILIINGFNKIKLIEIDRYIFNQPDKVIKFILSKSTSSINTNDRRK